MTLLYLSLSFKNVEIYFFFFFVLEKKNKNLARHIMKRSFIAFIIIFKIIMLINIKWNINKKISLTKYFQNAKKEEKTNKILIKFFYDNNYDSIR